jgi:hypothetical protein
MNDDIETRRSADMEDSEIFDDGPDDSPAPKDVDLGSAELPEGVDLSPEIKTLEQQESPFDDQGPFDEEQPQQEETKPEQPQEETKPKPGPLDGLTREELARLDQKIEDMEKQGKFSPKVQRRINKAVGAQKAAEAEAEQLRQEVQNLRQGMGGMRLQALDATISNLEDKAKALRSEAAKALDEGDTEKWANLNDRLVDTRSRLLNAQGIKARVAPGDNAPPQQQPQPSAPQQRPQGADVAQLPQRSQDWIADRGFMDWPMSAKHFAHGVDHDLGQEGYDPNSPEYFEEMDNRIKAAFPQLYAGEEPAAPTLPAPRKNAQGAAPVAEPSNVTGQAPQRGKVTLTAEDQASMRNFGLDPNNPEHLKEYARNKSQGS